MGYEPTIVNGCLHSENPGAWYQYFIADHIPHPVEGTYVATVRVKGSVEADLTLNMGWGWGSGEQAPGKLHVGPEWAEATVTYHGIPAKDCNLVLQPGGYDGTIDIDWVKGEHIVKMNSIPLTPEEKKDTLTWAMDKWISGMMEACDGKVKAWDVVNEAISGGDPDGDGVMLCSMDPERLIIPRTSSGRTTSAISTTFVQPLSWLVSMVLRMSSCSLTTITLNRVRLGTIT